jgi:glycopeptidolipid biosynthesis protein
VDTTWRCVACGACTGRRYVSIAASLGLDRAGINDSFFDLGGNSFSSMQAVARARAARLICRPRDIFVEQTVARLARVAARPP